MNNDIHRDRKERKDEIILDRESELLRIPSVTTAEFQDISRNTSRQILSTYFATRC
jgi:hypothetical protein